MWAKISLDRLILCIRISPIMGILVINEKSLPERKAFFPFIDQNYSLNKAARIILVSDFTRSGRQFGSSGVVV